MTVSIYLGIFDICPNCSLWLLLLMLGAWFLGWLLGYWIKDYRLKAEINGLHRDIKNWKNKLTKTESEVEQAKYDREKIGGEIATTKSRLLDSNVRYKALQEKYNQLESKGGEDVGVSKLENYIVDLERKLAVSYDNITKMEELEDKIGAYHYYLRAVSRDGVPYNLIQDALPTIEGEVNNILSQIVDFSIIFKMDGKSIDNYIVYDEYSNYIGFTNDDVDSIEIRIYDDPNFVKGNLQMYADNGWGDLQISKNMNFECAGPDVWKDQPASGYYVDFYDMRCIQDNLGITILAIDGMDDGSTNKEMVKSTMKQVITKIDGPLSLPKISDSKGGGCLIATATYGSELAPQVQQLRELRDNQLLQTESGTAFMGTFNDIYY